MDILAHRGFWNHSSEKNTATSFEHALQHNFGIETDIRDANSQLVISHDIAGEKTQTFDQFLKQVKQFSPSALLALNIKADGLQALLTKINQLELNYFVFDMSVPDMLGYLNQGFNVYTRYSEYEQQPALLNDCQGVWVDNFSNNEIDLDAVLKFLLKNKKIALVSPELHSFKNEKYWFNLKNFIQQHPEFDQKISLCTDYPLKAKEFFDATE